MTLEREIEYDKAYMNMAEVFGKLSYGKRAKVGCVIVSNNGQIVSQGFNGTPTGRDNCCEYIENAELHTKQEVLHAESNAISKCAKWGASTDEATLYVTLSPCFECAKMIFQSGIKRVVYKEVYRDVSGIELLKELGVKVEKISK